MVSQTQTPLAPGTHTLGPNDARLTVKTGRAGAIARVGHDLLLEVREWSGTVEVSGQVTIAVSANPGSIRVVEGTGGMQKLGDDDAANINQTIGDEVLGSDPIEFRSTEVAIAGAGVTVNGELTLRGARRPLTFDLELSDDGRVTGQVAIKQTDFGMKPYSTLFGTLKVADEVRVAIDGHLPDTTQERSADG
jgi:hypothetical protein